MLPIPARTAVLAFCGSVAVLLAGVLASSPTATMLGGGLLLGLAAALALTAPLGARLRRQRMEFAWWLGHGEQAQGAVVGAPFEVHGYVRNRSLHALRLDALLPVVPMGVRVLEGQGGELALPARARTEIRLRLHASAAGRVVLQGLAVMVPGPFGLFSAPLYFPSPLSIKVLPRAAARTVLGARPAGGEAVEHAGPTPLRRRGAGTELHEIREHRPGDPFKAIAWKASARAGKLLVREVEREVQDTLQIVIDASGSMRGGAPGERKLDHCIEIAALLAHQALERGDRVGLLTVDGRVISQVAAAEGRHHMLRIYDGLLKATEVVDADLTQIDDDGVAALVGLYLRQQEGKDFSGEGAGGWDLPALAAHVTRALQSEPDHEEVVASSPEHVLLRRFCRVRGIPLPYRADTRGLAKAGGLAQALRKAAGNGRTPRSLLLLTDLDGVHDPDTLLQTLRLLKARQHRLGLLLPDPESLMQASASPLERTLRHVYGMQEQRRLREAQASAGKLGIPVLRYDAQKGAAAVLRGAQGVRSVA